MRIKASFSRHKCNAYCIWLGILLYALNILGLFSFRLVDHQNKIDGSWQYTLSTLRSDNQHVGNQVYYTYGPLYEKIPSLPLGGDNWSDYIVGVLLVGSITSGLIYAYYSLIKSAERDNKDVPLLALVIVLTIALTLTYIDTLYYLALIAALVAARDRNKLSEQLLILGPLALFSFYKVSFSIVFLALFWLAFVPLKLKRMAVIQSLKGLAATITLYVAFFSLLTSAAPTRLFRYLYIGLMNSSAYTEFMGLGFAENKMIVLLFSGIFYSAALFFIFKIFWMVLRRGWRVILQEQTIIYLIVLASSFFAYKQAVVRSDDHLLAFTPFLFVLALVIVAPQLRRLRIHLLVALSILCIVGQVFMIGYLYKDPVTVADYADRQFSLIAKSVTANPLSPLAFNHFRERAIANDAAQEELALELRNYFANQGNKTKGVILFGNNTKLSNDLPNVEVDYLPFIQNYAAFPPAVFDELYIKEVQSKPDHLILLEEMEPSINERVPAHELNGFFQYVLHNYRLVAVSKDARQFLLEKMSQHTEQCKPAGQFSAKKGSAFDIPDAKLQPGHYLKLTAAFEPSPQEKIVTLLMKKPIYTLVYINKEGNVMERRTTQSILEHGISIKPTILSYTDHINGAAFELKQVLIKGGIQQQDTIDIKLSDCGFTP